MSTSNRYGNSYRNGNGYGNGYGNFVAPPKQSQDDYDPYGDDYGGDARYGPPVPSIGSRSSPAPGLLRDEPPIPAQRERAPPVETTNAERQIAQVLEHIKQEWPSMCETDCIPVQLALQLLDSSSVGRAHEYDKFQETYEYLQESLKGIVHEHHQGFNSSIGTFHKIQGSIQASQKRVRALKESLAAAKTSLCTTDPDLKKLSATSQAYEGLLNTLNELQELRVVPDQLEAHISEKRFVSAVDVLQNALRKLRKPELDEIGALSDLRSYLANQDTALMDILVEELHEHLYLKSPYCQERWQGLAKDQGASTGSYADSTSNIVPFHECVENIDFERAATEDPAKNPEADTFSYIGLLVEALNKLGRLEAAVDILKQRMPVELFGTVNYTINEVDQRHPSSLRGGSTNSEGLYIYGSRETQMRADVIYDLLWTLYGKFEAIAEAHRVFHETIKALIRREGAGNNSALLGSFKELWNLYQNEIRSLLHNYVTTDADLYHFSSSPKTGASLVGKKDAAREHLFKFAETDPKAPDIVAEYDALESILRAAVPGLTDDRKGAASDKRAGSRPILDPVGSRKGAAASYETKQGSESHKSLVEPSVFNMSLLLPPTLVFLQRLRTIVPPGSDLATSTLTTFLDNFLVNVFHPQLDETLDKLSDTIFGEADSFLQDQEWARVAKKPVFKGTTAFFTVVTAFCKMLATIPPDQALSSLIITQMMRYYDKCFGWYKSLVTKGQDEATDSQTLRLSATLALEPSAITETAVALWSSEEPDAVQLEKEIDLLISRADEKSLELSDVVQDKDVMPSLCMLYTSMKWLSVKTAALRYITQNDVENARPTLPRQSSKRWTLMNDSTKTSSDEGPVHLPMTPETAQAFDGIVSSYEELATKALLTLHLEIRCQIIYALHRTLTPETSAPYVLDQEVTEPDPGILTLNGDLITFDETVGHFLRPRESAFIRTGLGRLIDTYLVRKALLAKPMNHNGCGRMQLNILVLQQNLKNVEEGVDLRHSAEYYALFEKGPGGVVEKARADKEAGDDVEGDEEAKSMRFSYEELEALMELCFSEQLANPERGIAAAAKRQMGEKMLALSEYTWQT
ncbi:Sec8 exocyst complex component-specific domain-containing protein [Sodiomyces alkalinus F11]|uniref:Exocyst complex component Sec8 n=1 Tax=Sodiomyces alkalinus (strain CBS 110278 / VKM F-3762 / F11) TaxID=1314773 RepID=A0A3N2PXG8_SODAK|nr:Sec8 exocyst complex component-specific domain-containing protein [Sodiomyces alkalinus F11]ROT39164.1 Sec8 exocyst complex component-specific domain-containing protein [Sodiomyces alkalinus F11]